MKLCVFSDIHGNGPAFEAAAAQMRQVQADAYIFLGDLCGYYYDQLEILPVLKSIPNLLCVRGNHDQVFLDILQGNEDLRQIYATHYGSSMENLLAADFSELSVWIESLPVSLSGFNEKIACYHGSPDDNLEGYIYPDTPAGSISQNCELLLLGHTHYKMNMRTEGQWIVNPGSLGQPRDGGKPSFAVIDFHNHHVLFHEVNYDRTDFIRKLKSKKGTTPYMMDVLNRDWGDGFE